MISEDRRARRPQLTSGFLLKVASLPDFEGVGDGNQINHFLRLSDEPRLLSLLASTCSNYVIDQKAGPRILDSDRPMAEKESCETGVRMAIPSRGAMKDHYATCQNNTLDLSLVPSEFLPRKRISSG